MDAFSKRIIDIFKREVACLKAKDCGGCSYYGSCHFGSNSKNHKEIVEAYNAAIEKVEKLDKITEIIDDSELEAWEVLDQVKEVISE